MSKTLVVGGIKWDCDGHDPIKDCGLPTTIVVLNAPGDWNEDNDEQGETLSDLISDAYGFLHDGYNVEEATPDVAGKTGVISTHLGIVEWPA